MLNLMRMKQFLRLWTAAAMLVSVSPALAADSPQDTHAAWLKAKLYGSDNESAALRRVVINEKSGGGYSVLIENQFGFLCDLQFGEDGHPAQLSGCVSRDSRNGNYDAWFVQEPPLIPLHCAKMPKEFVCRGSYTLASSYVSLGRTEINSLGRMEMAIAMPRSALPQAEPEPVNQPTLAYCTADKVNIRSEASPAGSILGQLTTGRVVLTGMQKTEEGAWYQLDLPNAPGSGWVYADYIALPDAPMPDLAQIILQFGNTPAKAKALFGQPDSIAQSTENTGGISEEILFYPGHQAVYNKGLLSRVVLEPKSPLSLGRWKLGQAASSCLALGEPEKQGDIWTFMISPADSLRFTIKNDQIAGAEFVNGSTN